MASPLAPVFPTADLARFGDRPAVHSSAGVVSYADLAARVSAAARALAGPRRLILLAARNDLDSLVGYLAALEAGHPLLLAPGDKPDAVRNLVARYDPDIVLGAPDQAVVVRRTRSRHELNPELALLLSTSGSTGSPKLVRLSRDNLAANAAAIAESLGIRPDDRAVTTLPMHYCYGLSVINSHLAVGASLVLTDLSVVDPCFWDLVRSHRATTFAAVPYTFDLLDRVGFPDMDLPHLRYLTQAGGRLAPQTVQRYAELGQRRGFDLVVMYGQTEATARMAYLPPECAATCPWSIGRAVPGGELRIDPVPGLEHGELVYCGRNVMLGYAESAADLRLGRTVTELRTGDLARRHPDGLYEVVGRLSRFVKVVGLRVDLGRVEQILAEDGVTAAATGEDGRIVVAAEGDRDPALLAKVLAATIGVPRAAVVVHPVESLPRLPSGKPDYPAVLALDAPSAPAGDEAAPAPGRQRRALPTGGAVDVRRIFAEQFDLDHVDDGATFVSLGGDSLSYVSTSLRLEDALGHLPADWHVTPVATLAERAASRPRTAGRWAWLRDRFAAPLETSILLRAVAIVLIVATHAKLLSWPGTAHVLLAVAGFNFARFQLAGQGMPRLRRQLRSVARVVVPSVAFIALAWALTDSYSLANVALLNAVVGPETWTTQWHFWFVEMLVYVLLGVSALLAVPWAGRAAERFPLAFPVALLGLGLLARFDVVDLGLTNPKPVLWLFALGWAVAAARNHLHRLALSAVTLAAVPGFFGDPRREAVIAGGILLLTWLPTVPVPAAAHRVLGVLAGASLYVYLTHWLVYPPLLALHPAVAVLASLLVGVGYWALVGRLSARAGRLTLTR